jgi:hypothetical protein
MRLRLPRRQARRAPPERVGADDPPEGQARRAREARAARRRRPTAQEPAPRRDSPAWLVALVKGIAEVVAIAREMLAIPARMALRLAERLGLVVLAGWRFVLPVLLAALALLRRALGVAQRQLTPARAIAAVAIAAACILIAAQFVDYREVRAGVPAYAEVESVAPAPRVDGSAKTAGSAHAYLLVPLALAAVGLVAAAMLGRWRVARLLVVVGAAVVAVTLLVDLPKGLDEGQTAVQFEGAEARLLGAFWVQLAAGVVIGVCGVLLSSALRPGRARTRRSLRLRRRGRRDRSAGGAETVSPPRVQGARP